MTAFLSKPAAFFAGAVFLLGGWGIVGFEVYHAYILRAHSGLQLIPVSLGLVSATFGAAIMTMGNALAALDVMRKAVPLLESVIPGGRRKTDPPPPVEIETKVSVEPKEPDV